MEKFKLGAKCPLIISGPCSAETEEQTLETCRQLAAEGVVDVLRAGIWKPRTRPGTFEGVGLKGLAWLAAAKRETGLPIATEVASAKHVESALEFGVDLLWLGARTTVNPFLVQEIAEACAGNDVQILIKNPMHPEVALGQVPWHALCGGAHPKRLSVCLIAVSRWAVLTTCATTRCGTLHWR